MQQWHTSELSVNLAWHSLGNHENFLRYTSLDKVQKVSTRIVKLTRTQGQKVQVYKLTHLFLNNYSSVIHSRLTFVTYRIFIQRFYHWFRAATKSRVCTWRKQRSSNGRHFVVSVQPNGNYQSSSQFTTDIWCYFQMFYAYMCVICEDELFWQNKRVVQAQESVVGFLFPCRTRWLIQILPRVFD